MGRTDVAVCMTIFLLSNLMVGCIMEGPDSDLDGVEDSIDNCVDVSNTNQLNHDGDDFGNLCDDDDDNDSILDVNDSHPLDSTESSDLDGATSLVLDVGDGSDSDKYIDGSTIGQAGGEDHQDANMAPVEYSSDDTIDITCQVAPGTDVATGTLEMWIYIS